MAREVNKNNHWIFWVFVAVIFCAFVYITKSVIMPFVVGILVGYLFNPLVVRLTKRKVNRTLATTIIMTIILLAVVPAILLLLGVINSQILRFIDNLPSLTSSFITKAEPILSRLSEEFPEFSTSRIKEYLHNNTSKTIKLVGAISGKLIRGSFAFINIISLIVIAPVVAFYMLRDWELFIKKIDGLLPIKHKEELRTLGHQVDRAIAGFIRGQFSVCVILGTIYSIGLYIIGLHLGVAVGFMAGIISFIPYVGTITGFVTAMIIAFMQYDTFGPILQVIIVFGIGQVLESYYLTPKLVGDSVGLHPVWIMFAILAGGVILGFLGILIAVPVAAIIAVLIRYSIEKYKKSGFYQ